MDAPSRQYEGIADTIVQWIGRPSWAIYVPHRGHGATGVPKDATGPGLALRSHRTFRSQR
jgi:hypothetical protein